MLAAIILAMSMGSPLTDPSGSGSLYVFAQMGPWSDPVCGDARTTDFNHQNLINGIEDHILCIDGTASCQTIASAQVELRDDGFTAMINGWGDAMGGELHDTFSRHDTMASMTVSAEEDLRIHVSWFVLAAGLGTVNLELQRMGDIGGPNDPSPPIISRGASSYIDPISFDGIDVLPMPAGRWRFTLFSTHQALDTKPGFMMSFARTTHIATYVDPGDVDGNGTVDVSDLLTLLEQFGSCQDCLADLNADGEVDVVDLLQILADWDA